jgi:hypothetical protein
MRSFKLLSFVVLVNVVLLRIQICHAADLHLYLGIRSENRGDRDQVKTLAEQIKRSYKSGEVTLQEFELDEARTI